jgi:hypothetical protein
LFPPIQALPAHESREDDRTGSEDGDKRLHSFSLTGYRADHLRARFSSAGCFGASREGGRTLTRGLVIPMLLALEFAFMNISFLADMSVGTLALLYTVIFMMAAFLAVCWIAFPFIVLSKFNELLKVTHSIRRALNENNKGLQYLVDSAGRAAARAGEPLARESMR